MSWKALHHDERMDCKTGWYGVPGRYIFTKVHFVSYPGHKPICGAKLRKNMEF